MTTRQADIAILLLKLSLKISHPKAIPNIGVRKAKLATPDAGYMDNSQSQKINPIATTTMD
jgi:hypothetical protein